MEGDNELSLVLYTQSVGARILTTGDLPAKSEMESPPDCDILKVAHHGSKYATSDEFLRQTPPKTALISLGANNRSGPPTARVLEALRHASAGRTVISISHRIYEQLGGRMIEIRALDGETGEGEGRGLNPA